MFFFSFQGHFRYAKAFRLLGQLDSAIKVINIGLDLCQQNIKTDRENVKQLQELQTQYVTGMSFLSVVLLSHYQTTKF